MNNLGFSELSTELSALGIMMVSSEIEDNEKLLDEIQAKAVELRGRAQEEFDTFLASKNLEAAMGMIIPIQQ